MGEIVQFPGLGSSEPSDFVPPKQEKKTADQKLSDGQGVDLTITAHGKTTTFIIENRKGNITIQYTTDTGFISNSLGKPGQFDSRAKRFLYEDGVDSLLTRPRKPKHLATIDFQKYPDSNDYQIGMVMEFGAIPELTTLDSSKNI